MYVGVTCQKIIVLIIPYTCVSSTIGLLLDLVLQY